MLWVAVMRQHRNIKLFVISRSTGGDFVFGNLAEGNMYIKKHLWLLDFFTTNIVNKLKLKKLHCFLIYFHEILL